MQINDKRTEYKTCSNEVRDHYSINGFIARKWGLNN
jgi:hypothetical protein